MLLDLNWHIGLSADWHVDDSSWRLWNGILSDQDVWLISDHLLLDLHLSLLLLMWWLGRDRRDSRDIQPEIILLVQFLQLSGLCRTDSFLFRLRWIVVYWLGDLDIVIRVGSSPTTFLLDCRRALLLELMLLQLLLLKLLWSEHRVVVRFFMSIEVTDVIVGQLRVADAEIKLSFQLYSNLGAPSPPTLYSFSLFVF